MKIQNLKKLFFVFALILVAGVAVTGCMNRNVDESGSATPSVMPSYMPQGNATNGANGSAAGSATDGAAAQSGAGRFDWTKNAAQIEAQIAQISEISEARVVVTGNTALVGVKFSNAYQGEMTERIREMIAAEVMKADPEIQTVAVTAEEDDVKGVYDISDRTLMGAEMDTLKEDINEIVRNATTLR